MLIRSKVEEQNIIRPKGEGCLRAKDEPSKLLRSKGEVSFFDIRSKAEPLLFVRSKSEPFPLDPSLNPKLDPKELPPFPLLYICFAWRNGGQNVGSRNR